MTVEQAVEPEAFRRVMAAFPTGVTAVAAVVDGRPEGLAASSFTSVSLDPPMVSVCVGHTSTTWPRLRTAPRLGVSVLSDEQAEVGRVFAASGVDRFAGTEWHATDDGAIRVHGATAWLDCSIEATHRAGDHDIVVLRVHDVDADHGVHPLVFHASRFRRLER